MNEQDTEFWYGLVFGFGGFALTAVVLVVILVQVGAFTRARMVRRDEARDQELIDKYEQLATQSQHAQESATTELAGMRQRLEAIERLLREVE